MLIRAQWATDPPSKWFSVDSRDWASLPKRDAPPKDRIPLLDEKTMVHGFIPDDFALGAEPGLINRLTVQGVEFGADHLAVVHDEPGGCVCVYKWNDVKTEPRLEGEVDADVWRFFPTKTKLVLHNGSVTHSFAGFKQLREIFINPARFDSMANGRKKYTTGGLVIIRPLSEFVPPEDKHVRHGVWQMQELFDSSVSVAPPESVELWKGAVL